MIGDGSPQPQYSLRFLSGKCQGSDYLLQRRSEVLVGRSQDADLVLLEGMVSRLHARFKVGGGELSVEDLGSTNGTFVNGERISYRELTEGDRVLIGTSILKVVGGVSLAARMDVRPPHVTDSVATADTRGGYDLDGVLEETSMLELLELYGVSSRKAVIEVDSHEGAGRITLADGRLLACEVAGLGADATLAKRIFRMLTWSVGLFRVRAFVPPAAPVGNVSVAALLVEARHELDEYTVLMARLPHPDSAVMLARPLVRKLSELDELELDLLQLIHNSGRLKVVLDQWHETDVHTARRLLTLLDGGYYRRP